MCGDRVVRLTLERRGRASEELEVPCRGDAEVSADLVLHLTAHDRVRGREVEQLRDRRRHGDSVRAATDTGVDGASYAHRMPRSGLDPDTALDVLLSATCSRYRYTTDAAPVIAELHRIAGARLDILARVAGSWVGYYGDEHTRTLSEALLGIPGADAWVTLGRERRDAPVHGAPQVRP